MVSLALVYHNLCHVYQVHSDHLDSSTDHQHGTLSVKSYITYCAPLKSPVNNHYRLKYRRMTYLTRLSSTTTQTSLPRAPICLTNTLKENAQHVFLLRFPSTFTCNKHYKYAYQEGSAFQKRPISFLCAYLLGGCLVDYKTTTTCHPSHKLQPWNHRYNSSLQHSVPGLNCPQALTNTIL